MNTENHYQETDLGNISLNPRGEYNPEESYEYLDLVVLEGGSYVCLAENGATITGISPESGKTTQYWQVITIPGSLTPEYIAMHDRVVNLSEQVGADAEEVRTAEQNVSGMELNVTQMQEQTRQSAEAAEQSKDSSAGYAASADSSRQAAEESKQNIDAQVTGFDSHVADKTEEAENDIEAARIAANKAIIAQQEQSVNEVARVGSEAISTAQAAAQTATEKAQAADTSEKNTAASETAAKLSETNATKMAEQVAADKEQVANDRTAVENAKQEMTGSVAQIEQNTQGISELKSDLIQSYSKYVTGEQYIILKDSVKSQLNSLQVISENPNDYINVCGENLFDKNKLKVGYYLDSNGNEIESYLFSSTQYIPVLSDTDYYYVSDSNLLEYIEYFGLFYDINKNVISTIPITTNPTNESFHTPANCCFVRLMVLTNDIENQCLFFGSNRKEYIDADEIYSETIDNIDIKNIKSCKNTTHIFTFFDSNIKVNYNSNTSNTLKEYFSTPFEYGAIGNGIHDDTRALIRCISNNKSVYIPKGNYLISDTLYFEEMEGCNIYSDSAEIYFADETNNKPMMSFVKCTNMKVKGLKFNGNRENQTLVKSGEHQIDFSENCACIILETVNDFEICDCTFYNCQGDGIQVDVLYNFYENYDGYQSQHINIHNNIFEKIGRNGISIAHSKFANIYSNIFKNISIFSTTIACGIDVESESGTGIDTSIYETNIKDNIFQNCIFGILVCGQKTHDTIVQNNTITNTTRGEYGFIVSNLQHNVTFCGNTVKNNVFNVYSTGVCENVQLINNTLLDAKKNVGDTKDGGYHMLFTGICNNFIISGNDMHHAEGAHSIEFESDVNYALILNNTVFGNGGIKLDGNQNNCVLYNLVNGTINTMFD